MGLAGLLAGGAAGGKDPGCPFLPLSAAVVLWRRRNDGAPWPAAFRDAAIVALAGAAVVLPTLVKNVVFHGNPVYPFGGVRFGHPLIRPEHWHIFVTDANSRVLATEFASLSAF